MPTTLFRRTRLVASCATVFLVAATWMIPAAAAQSLPSGWSVVDIGRRTTRLEEVSGQYMGLVKFTKAGWAAVEAHLDNLDVERRDRLDITGLLSGLIGAGQSVVAVPLSGSWGEVDNADDLDLYERLILNGQMRMPA